MASVSAADKEKLPKAVEKKPYLQWTEAMRLKAGKKEAIIVPEIGGRITWYSLNGQNIIFENVESAGKTLDKDKDFWVGGYQCDIGPELKNIPDHPHLWMGRNRSRASRDYTVFVSSTEHDTLGIEMQKEIVIDPETGDLGITQTWRNISNRTISYCLWDRTLCKGKGFAFFALNKKSRFKAGWSIRRGQSPSYTYDGDQPASAKVRVLDGVLVAKAEGPATKLGADCDAGWIAYTQGKLLLIKYFPYYPKGNYSDGGNSVELYFDERFAELEPLSPEVKVSEQTTYNFPEKWVLLPLDKEIMTHEEVRQLVSRIPESPFEE